MERWDDRPGLGGLPVENVDAVELDLGVGTYIEPTAVIRGLSGPATRVRIGDHCYIGEGVQIICDDFSLGDFSKLHRQTTIHGYLPCSIGHNAWVGQFTVIDSVGGTTIGDNCGIGAHSQLWSHTKYGDTLDGCRFNSTNQLTVGKDVWFVGHCVVSPIRAHDRSMALAGSVVTRDMEANTVYAGTPAKAISDRVGPQFNQPSDTERRTTMAAHLEEFGSSGGDVLHPRRHDRGGRFLVRRSDLLRPRQPDVHQEGLRRRGRLHEVPPAGEGQVHSALAHLIAQLPVGPRPLLLRASGPHPCASRSTALYLDRGGAAGIRSVAHHILRRIPFSRLEKLDVAGSGNTHVVGRKVASASGSEQRDDIRDLPRGRCNLPRIPFWTGRGRVEA